MRDQAEIASSKQRTKSGEGRLTGPAVPCPHHWLTLPQFPLVRFWLFHLGEAAALCRCCGRGLMEPGPQGWAAESCWSPPESEPAVRVR